jgi:hypothetical protein
MDGNEGFRLPARAWDQVAFVGFLVAACFWTFIASERTPARERKIAGHPSLKPQSLLRQLVYSVLPLGTGVVADPFMGSGSRLPLRLRRTSSASAPSDTRITTTSHVTLFQNLPG